MSFIKADGISFYRSDFGDLPLTEAPAEGSADTGLYANYLNSKLSEFYVTSSEPIDRMPFLSFSEWQTAGKWLRKNGIGDVA